MKKFVKNITKGIAIGMLVLQLGQVASYGAWDNDHVTVNFGYSGGIGATREYIKETSKTANMYCYAVKCTPIYGGTGYNSCQTYLGIYEDGSYTSKYSTPVTATGGGSYSLVNTRATTNNKVKIFCRPLDSNVYTAELAYNIN